MYLTIFKPLADRFFALLVLIFGMPVLLFVVILLYAVNGGAVFFVQKRIGKNAAPFFLIKFKTMNDKKDSCGQLLPDEQRLTKVGNWIRKTSMDEVPQLFNVIKGEMSLVGPRPLLPEYLQLYNAEQKRRHNVLPGITGWAQVNGRNAISWKQKFEYDVWYVDRVSFKLDVRIIFITIMKVFIAEGVNRPGMATTEAFNGKN